MLSVDIQVVGPQAYEVSFYGRSVTVRDFKTAKRYADEWLKEARQPVVQDSEQYYRSLRSLDEETDLREHVFIPPTGLGTFD